MHLKMPNLAFSSVKVTDDLFDLSLWNFDLHQVDLVWLHHYEKTIFRELDTVLLR